MTVRFEFDLDDVDAENLIDCIRDAQLRAQEIALGEAGFESTPPDYLEWWKKRAAYLGELADKVAKSSKRIEKQILDNRVLYDKYRGMRTMTALRVHVAATKYAQHPLPLALKFDKLDRCLDNAKTYDSRAVLRALHTALMSK